MDQELKTLLDEFERRLAAVEGLVLAPEHLVQVIRQEFAAAGPALLRAFSRPLEPSPTPPPTSVEPAPVASEPAPAPVAAV